MQKKQAEKSTACMTDSQYCEYGKKILSFRISHNVVNIPGPLCLSSFLMAFLPNVFAKYLPFTGRTFLQHSMSQSCTFIPQTCTCSVINPYNKSNPKKYVMFSSVPLKLVVTRSPLALSVSHAYFFLASSEVL